MYSLTFSSNPNAEEEREADNSSAVFYSSCSLAVLSAARRVCLCFPVPFQPSLVFSCQSHSPQAQGCARGIGADPGGCLLLQRMGQVWGRLHQGLGACPDGAEAWQRLELPVLWGEEQFPALRQSC